MTVEDLQKLNDAIDQRVKFEIAWALAMQDPRGQLPEHRKVLEKLGTARRRVDRLLEQLHLSIVKGKA